MNTFRFSLALLPLLVATSAPAAPNSNYGTLSGDANLYYNARDNRAMTDSAYSTAFLGLKYETPSFNGFQAAAAVRHGSELYEKEPGDADDGINTLLTEGYISYQNDQIALTLGRQEIDLEWVADFHEAVTLTLSSIPDTELTIGYSQAFAVADEDELHDNFADIGDDGGYFLDARFQPMEHLTLNPYLIHVNDVYDAAGFKAEYEYPSGVGITAHYAASDVDVAGEADGSIWHLELRGTLGDAALRAGYISTDDQGGTGHLDDLGENISDSIFEEGNQVYVADSDTYYLGAEYALGNLTLGALYGQSDYAGSLEESELNLTAAYDFADTVENLSLSLVFADIDANTSTDDYQKYTLMLTYGF